MKKTLKSIQKKHGMLNESYAWERTSGGALPTLADVQAKYNAKSVNEQEIPNSTQRCQPEELSAFKRVIAMSNEAPLKVETAVLAGFQEKTVDERDVLVLTDPERRIIRNGSCGCLKKDFFG